MKKLLAPLFLAGIISVGAIAPAEAANNRYITSTCRTHTVQENYWWYNMKSTTYCTYVTSTGVKIYNAVYDSWRWRR